MIDSAILRRVRMGMVCVLAAGSFAPTLAFAQAFPNQTIKWIVPYPPGGGSDVVARAVGNEYSTMTGSAARGNCALDRHPSDRFQSL